MSSLDIVIFFGFLAVNLGVGMYYSRNIKTIEEYAIGDRNFSTSTIIATIIATFIGGGVFSLTLSKTYSDGLAYIFLNVGEISAFFITAYFLAPRMAEFLGILSIAEAMGNLFGKKVRVITAVCSIAITAGAVAMQFKVASTILGYFFGINSIYATIISGMIVIIYSAGGGIKAVTFTDIIQFLTFGAFIPILALVIYGTLHNPEIVFDTITYNSAFDFKEVFSYSNPHFWSLIILFPLFAYPICFDPAMFQRVSMAKNTKQIRKSFFISGVILIVIYLFMDWIAVLLLSVKNDIAADSLLSYVIDNYTYPGFKGFALIGIVAMLMSTADSYINSSAVIFAHDFCKLLGIKWIKNNELLSSKLFAVAVGVFAIIAALSSNNLFDLLILINEFYMPIVAIPILFAALGFRSSSKSVLIGMAAGFISIILWRFIFPNTEIEGVVPATFMNMVFLFASHYMLKQPGGWVGVKNPLPLIVARMEQKRKINNFITNIKEFNILRFCNNNLPLEEITYTYLGIFIIASTYSSLYTIPESLRIHYKEIYNFIYHSVLIMSAILLSYPIWPNSFKNEKFITIYWNIAIFYILICVGSILVIISHFSEIQLMVFMLNMVVMGIILRWQVTLLMLAFGIIISSEFFKLYTHAPIPGNFGNIQFKVIYFLLLFSSILLAFIKPKQKYDELAENYKKDLEQKNNVNLSNLFKVTQHRKELLHKLDKNCVQLFKSLCTEIKKLETDIDEKSDKQELVAEKANLLKIAKRLKDEAEYLDEVILKIKDEISIKPASVELKQFFARILNHYKEINLNSEMQISTIFKVQHEQLEIDEELMLNTIIALLDYGRLSSESNIAHFLFEDDCLDSDLLKTKKDAVKITLIFTRIKVKPDNGDNLLNSPNEIYDNFVLSEIAKIINAHYGKLEITLNNAQELVYTLIIPTQIKKITPTRKATE
ncbi:sodium:solute symporter family transporter [Rickettsia endosymbiont of Polydrusus tereticollis]|uniref:sodium:solute symporter family transporter n=1 Tax=Rickettsia endosymbiont of Polydrusus tereticollis TaxID=3066251 RepID=UPI003132F8A1